MKRIVLESIPHEKQAYETCGDYFESDDEIRIVVSDLGDPQLEQLIAVHELIEVLLMKAADLPLVASTEYDIQFEKARADGDHYHVKGEEAAHFFWFNGRKYTSDAEPGDAPDCPYAPMHNFATSVERLLCAAFGRKWADYEDAVAALPQNDVGGRAR
jgi:hypothetical protein